MDIPAEVPYGSPPAPRRGEDGVLTYPNALVADVLGYRPLHLDLHVPAGPAARPWPVALWIHGGAWWGGSRVWAPESGWVATLHDRSLRRGYAVADVDYRLSREAAFPAQLHDVKAAIRWLRTFAAELHLDPGRFAAWGDSAGGHLAALAGLTGAAAGPDLDGRIGVPGGTSEVQAVVDWYGVATLVDDPATGLPVHDDPDDDPAAWLLGGPPAARPAEAHRASPLSYVHPAAPPFQCVHGTADAVVPYRHSEWLAAALREHGVRCDLHPVSGAGHVFEGAPDVGALVDVSLDFLDDVL